MLDVVYDFITNDSQRGPPQGIPPLYYMPPGQQVPSQPLTTTDSYQAGPPTQTKRSSTRKGEQLK